MTEEQQGGTTPEAEALAPTADEAPKQAGGAVAIADEPVSMNGVDESQNEEPTASVVTPAASTADATTDDETAAGPQADSAAGVADPAASVAQASDVEAPEEAAPEASVAETTAVADEPADQPVVASPLDEADTADAPAAGDDDEEPTPVRDLGPEPTTMEELLAEQDSDIKSFKHGDVVEGTVVRIDKDEILVDIGAKSEGVVSNRELYGRHAESQPQLAIGDVVLVYVLQP